MRDDGAVLSARDLCTYFFTFRGVVKAVDGVSLRLRRAEMTGLVGESGSGKSVTALSLMRLVPPPGRVMRGAVWLEGRDLLVLPEGELQRVRGARMAMIFQNPRAALNPVLAVGEQICGVYLAHRNASRKAAQARAVELLDLVNVSDPGRFLKRYPHELSGGMCQRAMIVMALMCEPVVLIADEPTTGLDVTVQSQILELMREIRQRVAAAQLLITHDLGVVAETCDRVCVMYAGHMAETAPTRQLFRQPLHPYTRALLRSIPRVDREAKMEVIPGEVPNLLAPPSGCPFHPRCTYALTRCREEMPAWREVAAEHGVACHAV